MGWFTTFLRSLNKTSIPLSTAFKLYNRVESLSFYHLPDLLPGGTDSSIIDLGNGAWATPNRWLSINRWNNDICARVFCSAAVLRSVALTREKHFPLVLAHDNRNCGIRNIQHKNTGTMRQCSIHWMHGSLHHQKAGRSRLGVGWRIWLGDLFRMVTSEKLARDNRTLPCCAKKLLCKHSRHECDIVTGVKRWKGERHYTWLNLHLLWQHDLKEARNRRSPILLARKFSGGILWQFWQVEASSIFTLETNPFFP